MYKACSRCGKIHSMNYQCRVHRDYKRDNTRVLRSTYQWTQKSQEIRERANYLCEVCRSENIYTYKNIEVHHIIKVGADESKLLDNENLICLCQFHHKLADKGALSTELLQELARTREESFSESG